MQPVSFSRRLACAVALSLTISVGMTTQTYADAAPFKLFDGHLHPVSDDTVKYPHNTTMVGPPPSGDGMGDGMGGGGMPPGVGGQEGGNNTSERAATDFDKRALAWMDEEGVEGAAAVQKRGTYGTDNSYTLDISEAHPDRLHGIVILDAEKPESAAQLRDMINKRGAAGIRLTGAPAADGSLPWLNSAQARKVWEVANAAGAVMDIMITNQDNTKSVPTIIELAKTYPNVRLVLDHALFPKVEGGPEYGINATYQQMAKQKNIYYKFTIINIDSYEVAKLPVEDYVRRLVDVYGADHVLWGSDAGNSFGSYKELVERVVASASKLNDAEKRKMLHDTGASVFINGGKLKKK